MSRVYILEDDATITELVRCTLELSGIDVSSYGNANDFFGALSLGLPDMAILDIMLPDMDGFKVITKVKREYPDLPVVFLSALGSEIDKVKGLELGAEDYITKPFGVMELTARVKAVLRRHVPQASESDVITEGNMVIDSRRLKVTVDGEEVEITHKAFLLLAALVRNKGRVMSRTDLLNKVWGYDYIGETRTVDNHIKILRNKTNTDRIETVFGVGYKWKES